MKVSFHSYKNKNKFSHEKLCTQRSFSNEVQSNSEMAHLNCCKILLIYINAVLTKNKDFLPNSSITFWFIYTGRIQDFKKTTKTRKQTTRRCSIEASSKSRTQFGHISMSFVLHCTNKISVIPGCLTV